MWYGHPRCAGLLLPSLNVHTHNDEPQIHLTSALRIAGLIRKRRFYINTHFTGTLQTSFRHSTRVRNDKNRQRSYAARQNSRTSAEGISRRDFLLGRNRLERDV